MIVVQGTRSEVKKTAQFSYGTRGGAREHLSPLSLLRSLHSGLRSLGSAKNTKAFAGLAMSALFLGVVAFASPSVSAMTVNVSSSGNSNFNTHQTAVFHVTVSVQSGELIPITDLTATINGVGTPDSVSVTSPPIPANHAVTQFDGEPFIQAVSASAFSNSTSCSTGYSYTYGCGVQGPAHNNYVIQVSTGSLAQMAGLTSGQSGTFTLTITVHTSTGDLASTPITFTISDGSGSSGHGH
jgi:hypothetical protein